MQNNVLCRTSRYTFVFIMSLSCFLHVFFKIAPLVSSWLIPTFITFTLKVLIHLPHLSPELLLQALDGHLPLLCK